MVLCGCDKDGVGKENCPTFTDCPVSTNISPVRAKADGYIVEVIYGFFGGDGNCDGSRV